MQCWKRIILQKKHWEWYVAATIPVSYQLEEDDIDVIALIKDALIAHGIYYDNTKNINRIDFKMSTHIIVVRQ